ncbi:hypothetical protein ACN47E_005518 [Coniothyrium glycines]
MGAASSEPSSPHITHRDCGPDTDYNTCPFEGHCRQPLAWSLQDGDVSNQDSCILFSRLPSELRNLIWEFALTDETSFPPDREQATKQSVRERSLAPGGTIPTLYPSDIGFGLLSTCRAIYLETYLLPLILNPYYRWKNSMPQNRFLHWQCASKQSFDMTVQQIALEENSAFSPLVLKDSMCNVGARHEGVYIIPYPQSLRTHLKLDESPYSQDGSLAMIPANGLDGKQKLTHVLRNAGKVELPTIVLIPPTLRVTRARPLVSLTIRLGRMDWWTWTDDPDSTNPLHQLGLDPAVGTGKHHENARATAGTMQYFAEERRAGRFQDGRMLTEQEKKYADCGWGRHIAALPDLKSLEFILETFAPKTSQLDKVVECAKTWTFPIQGARRVLSWNGEVEPKRWTKKPDAPTIIHRPAMRQFARPGRSIPQWYDDCNEMEVRIIRYRDKK